MLYVLTIPSHYEMMEGRVEKLNHSQVKVLPKTEDVAEAAAIIKYGDVLFSVDTGIIHVASTYNLPIVGIYPNAPLTYKRFEPKSDKYYVSFGSNPDGTSIDGYDGKEVIKNVRKILKEIEKALS